MGHWKVHERELVPKVMASFSRSVLALRTFLHERVAALDAEIHGLDGVAARPGCMDGGGHWPVVGDTG